jgi:hypothetical protein
MREGSRQVSANLRVNLAQWGGCHQPERHDYGPPATHRASSSRRIHASRVPASISPFTEKVMRAQVPRPWIRRPTSC